MGDPRRVAKQVNLAMEQPSARAEADGIQQVSTFSIVWRILGGSLQVRLAGASASSLSHVVFMIGAMVPPAVALVICLAARAATAATLTVCLFTMLLSGLFTWRVYRDARTAHSVEQQRDQERRRRERHDAEADERRRNQRLRAQAEAHRRGRYPGPGDQPGGGPAPKPRSRRTRRSGGPGHGSRRGPKGLCPPPALPTAGARAREAGVRTCAPGPSNETGAPAVPCTTMSYSMLTQRECPDVVTGRHADVR
jgi:hypothetical protein